VIHQARDMSPTQRAAAELLLGRPLDDKESISVQAFEPTPASDQRRREVSAELRRLFSEVDLNLRPTTNDEAEEIFTEAMRSSRPAYRTHR
jgi:Asp-tRNA(Asn)/Glu-tRNA(Gln) amidotransferase A subunit family amidase